MNSPAAVRLPARSRLALIVAGVLALLGSLLVTAPAQAGCCGYNPCSYRCGGYEPYRYAPRYYEGPRYYRGCSSCGCYRRCGSVSRGGTFYERRYVEREYVERRYGYGGYRRHYGYYPYGGGGYGYRRPWGNGYGGVGRDWRPYNGYEPSGDRYYEGAPRPPEPIGYEGDPYGY
jgi:hypothetical protein